MDNENRTGCGGKLAAGALCNACLQVRRLFSPGSSKRPHHGPGPRIKQWSDASRSGQRTQTGRL